MTTETSLRFSRIIVDLPGPDLRAMLRLMRLLYRLSRAQAYRDRIFPDLPESARFDPGHASLMMGYDFHLGEKGPQLIEVNTNAGGGYISWLAEKAVAQESPGISFARLQQRLMASFKQEWRMFNGNQRPLQRVVILDDDPKEQALYEEMVAYCEWLNNQGIHTWIVSPDELDASASGVYFKDQKIDLIYNRHCDFFLETPSMLGIRKAYLGRSICLSPNPFAYGLLADKRRMILWSDEKALKTLTLKDPERNLLLDMVPFTRMMEDYQSDEIWDQRKDFIFKPVTSFGAKGVLMGKSVSRKRFSQLDAHETLVQRVVPPSIRKTDDGAEYKTDFRLYVYRNRLIGVGARLYQGQVTNLQTEGGGFAPVRIV